MGETQTTQAADKKPVASTTVPNLGKVQEDLHSAVASLDSAVAKLEALPHNHCRTIWKEIIQTIREDVNRYATKLSDLMTSASKPSKADPTDLPRKV